MKRIFFILLLSTIHVSAISQAISVESLRKEYYKLNTDSVSCKKTYSKIQNTTSSNHLIIGYKGAIYAAMANHVKSKQEKIKLFNEGRKLLDESIANDSSNIELHFLRFTIQSNCPKALGYYKQINSDKNFIIANFKSIPASDFKNKMAKFLNNSAHLNATEKQKIK